MTKYIHISDLQLGFGKGENNPNDERAGQLVEKVIREDPDFVIHSGDCIHGTPFDHLAGQAVEYDEVHNEYWSMYQQTVAPLAARCPLLGVVGNHDHTFPDRKTERFCRYNGREGKPPYYSVIIKDVRVIGLDVVPFRHRGGFLSETAQAAWLREELSAPREARCTVVVGHYPIFMSPSLYHTVDASLLYDEETGEEGVLLPMLRAGKADLYLCGHLHIYERARFEGLTQVMAAGYGIAYPDLLEIPTNRYLQVQDKRQCYVRFTLAENEIQAEAIALDGETIDAWTQPLNQPNGG